MASVDGEISPLRGGIWVALDVKDARVFFLGGLFGFGRNPRSPFCDEDPSIFCSKRVIARAIFIENGLGGVGR